MPSAAIRSFLTLLGLVASFAHSALIQPARARSIETLDSIGGLPAHVAGGFTEISTCARSSDGEYLIFDRRMHSVSSVQAPYDAVRVLVQIGAEPGKLLHPSAFGLAADGRFVVADAPGNKGRIQVFLTSGASLGGFTLATREVPTLVFENYLQSGIGSLAFTGRSILINQPELGTLLSEYAMDGGVSRTFGTLRPTGQEHDREVNLALNTGLPIINPQGGFYFVFLGGVPMFRKYDAAGRLSFERHIEGPELDDYIRSLPNSWPKRRTEDGELPIVQPAVRAAGADADGNLWVSLMTPVTYVYDNAGDKRRTLQFRGAGVMAPRSFFFTRGGTVLVAPGCYEFNTMK